VSVRGHHSRRRLAVWGLVVVVLLGLLGAAVTHAQSGRAKSRDQAEGRERFDMIGEDRRSPLHVVLQAASFPRRSLLVTMPRRHSHPTPAVHVYEDGQAVPSVAVILAGTTSATRSYELSYVSRAPHDEREVELSVIVDGIGVRDLDYAAPPAPSGIAGGGGSFWDSGPALIAASLVAAILLAIALLAVLVPRQRRGELRQRVAGYTAPVSAEPEELPDRPKRPRLTSLERLLQGLSWWPRFATNVEIARFNRPAVELVAITALITVVAAALIGAAAGTAVIALIILPVGPLLLRLVVRMRLRRQRDLFGQQLASHLEELASALRAGHGLTAGLAVMAESAAEPSRGEWSRVVADERLGKPLEDALRSMATRMQSNDVEQVALVASLHQRTGGNMAEVLERVADSVRERSDLRRELKALTAQARLSGWVITALPPGLIVVITALNHNYMRPLFTTTGGLVMLAIGAGLLTLGALVIRKLTDIKV
jgi:tight adherence protein B